MKRALPGVLLLLVLPLVTAAKKPAAPPLPVGVTVSRSGSSEVVRAVLPGWLSGVELPRRADGHLDVVLLLGTGEEEDDDQTPPGREAAQPEGPRSLHRLDLSGELRPLLQDVPSGTLGSLDLDGDGAEEILVARKGELRSLGTAGRATPPRTVLDLSAFDLMLPSRWQELGVTQVLAAGVGRLRRYRPEGGGLTPAGEHDLPSRATRERWGLRLTSPQVVPVQGGDGLLAAGPEANGKQRLRSLLLSFGTEANTEAWSLLPAPEDANGVWYMTIDGKPFLIVTTAGAEKLGIFEGKKLRVFPLSSDRTRAGRRPVLATQTTSHLWNPVAPLVQDLDRDGKDDLVVLQLDGLGGGELIAETFFGRGDGRFVTPGRRQKWDLEVRGWSYGQDLTGDGIADLAAADSKRLLVFPGTSEPRKALLEKKPLVIPIDLGGGEGAGLRRLRVADLDGDGRGEAILSGSAGPGRGVVVVVRF